MRTGFALNDNLRSGISMDKAKLWTENASLFYGKFQALRKLP